MNSQGNLLFQPVYQMRVRLGDSFDRMDPGQYQRRQRILVRYFDNRKDIRFAPAWIDRLNLFDF